MSHPAMYHGATSYSPPDTGSYQPHADPFSTSDPTDHEHFPASRFHGYPGRLPPAHFPPQGAPSTRPFECARHSRIQRARIPSQHFRPHARTAFVQRENSGPPRCTDPYAAASHKESGARSIRQSHARQQSGIGYPPGYIELPQQAGAEALRHTGNARFVRKTPHAATLQKCTARDHENHHADHYRPSCLIGGSIFQAQTQLLRWQSFGQRAQMRNRDSKQPNRLCRWRGRMIK